MVKLKAGACTRIPAVFFYTYFFVLKQQAQARFGYMLEHDVECRIYSEIYQIITKSIKRIMLS